MKIPKTVSLKTLVVAILATLLASAFIFYVLAPTPTSTFWISPGVYPGAPDFTMWSEGGNYFAKNVNGEIEFSGSNFTEVFESSIAALPTATVTLPDPAVSQVSAPYGRIYITAGQYSTAYPLEVPLGSRIIIEGDGTTQQAIGNGVNGGTQIINTGTGNAFEAVQQSGAVFCTGSILILKNLEFVQSGTLASETTPVLNLDGMAQGLLENVQVVRNYAGIASYMDGTGIRLYTNNTTGDTGGLTKFSQVIITGFKHGLVARIDHWSADFLEITRADLAINWSICLQNKLSNVHIFNCSRFFAVYGGFTTYGIAYVDGLYLEDCDTDSSTATWIIDSGFHGMLKINRVNVESSLAAGILWNVTEASEGRCKIWFTDVMTSGSTTFPAPTNPTYTAWTNTTNTYMQLVEVNIGFNNTVSGLEIQINGLNLTDGGNADTADHYTFILRPGDRIAVNANADRTNWVWRPISAERWHYDD